jgi:hypothetical protein
MRIGPKQAVSLVAAIAMIAGAFGCGGGGDSSGSSSGKNSSASSSTEISNASTLSKATFVKRASAACLEQREDTLERVPVYEKRHRSDGLSPHELTESALKAAVLSTVEAEIAALEKLGAPAGEEEAIEGINALLHDALIKAKGEEKLTKVEGAFQGVDTQLRKFGLPACAKNG